MFKLNFEQHIRPSIDNELKERFAALYLKHQLKDDCALAGHPKAFNLAAEELLKIRYPYNVEIPPGVEAELADTLERDPVVLRNVVKMSAKANYHFMHISPECIQLSTIELLDQIASRLNQMPKQSKGWKELVEMRVTVFQSMQLYKDLIPAKGDSDWMNGLWANSPQGGM